MVSKKRQEDSLEKAELLLELSKLKLQIADACKTFGQKPNINNLVAFTTTLQLENLIYYEQSERMLKALLATRQDDNSTAGVRELIDEALEPFGY